MAQRGNITLTDAATTPVNHVFYPVKSSGDVIAWQDRTQSVFAGQNRLTLAQRVATKATKAHKLSWKLETPILEQTSPSTSTGIQPAPTVAYTPVGVFELVLPDRMSLQERKDLLAQMRDLISEAITTTLVQDLDFIF
ncbi:coat protein [ssRNA phage Gerhypos.1_9]|uniref:Coat protein n=2 Tax=Fiersviridae TaxID=2842319 RepID=A0A8S5KXN1_9VIRU|nr:coat protein [ssRNA phage Gerhypos.1_9]QDH86627.1 MAG: hypothetical protein H1Bulk29156_000003 [Leviviridae sp.]DAD50518.1 TPA_asm: coat protein [ssRNA phage Gerhypos.1_9]